jgi:hypothetical protein
VAEFRRAVDDALSAAEAALRAALEQTGARRREAVTATLEAYGDALRAIVLAPLTGDAAQQAIYEARHSAEEASAQAAGQPPQDRL